MLSNQCLITLPEVRTKGLVPLSSSYLPATKCQQGRRSRRPDKEQRRTSEDLKDQMGILVSKLLERDSNVKQSFETVEKCLNHHRFALNKAEDQVRLQILEQSAMLS